MSEWRTIVPSREQKRAPANTVRVSWNRRSGADYCLCLRFGPTLGEILGWTDGKVKLLAQHHGPTNRLRLERAPPKTKGWGLHRNREHSTVVRVPLPGLQLTQNQRAVICQHELVGGGLIVTLPDWAWLPSYQRAREAAAIARLATVAEERLRRVV